MASLDMMTLMNFGRDVDGTMGKQVSSKYLKNVFLVTELDVAQAKGSRMFVAVNINPHLKHIASYAE